MAVLHGNDGFSVLLFSTNNSSDLLFVKEEKTSQNKKNNNYIRYAPYLRTAVACDQDF